MYILDIKISENREVTVSDKIAGNTFENNETLLSFTVPEAYSDYYKYLDIVKNDKEKTQTVVSTKNENKFRYKLPYELCAGISLMVQLVMKKDDRIFKSNIFSVVFNGSICATQTLEGSYQDTIEFIMENKADLKDIEDTKKLLDSKLDKTTYYDHFDIQTQINDSKVDKIDGKGLSENDYTDNEKEKLSLLPNDVYSKSETDEMLEDKVSKDGSKVLSTNDYTDNEKNKLSLLPNDVYSKTETDEMLEDKVSKDGNKVLSTNDYTDEEKNKLLSLPEKEEFDLKQDKEDNTLLTESKTVTGAINELKDALSKKLADEYTTAEKEKLSALPDKEELNRSFSNSLKAEESGNPLTIKKMSPIEHEMDISLSSGTVTDFSTVSVTKHGKNLLNPNVFLKPQTQNGVTFSYIPEEDVFCLNGTATADITSGFRTAYPYDLTLDETSAYRMRSTIVGGSAIYADGTARVFFLGIGDAASQSNNWMQVNIKANGLDNQNGVNPPQYSKLTYIWIYMIKAGDSFNNYKFRIQFEKGASATAYEKFQEFETATANAEGKVEGLHSGYPTTILEADNSEVTINCKYNKDINEAFNEFKQAIISLGGNI